jgi:hypothetical protein
VETSRNWKRNIELKDAGHGLTPRNAACISWLDRTQLASIFSKLNWCQVSSHYEDLLQKRSVPVYSRAHLVLAFVVVAVVDRA